MIFQLFFCISILWLCFATHFEGGSISYRIVNRTNSTVSIMITQTYIYLNSAIFCNSSYIINQSPKLDMSGRDENGKYLNCTANCSTSGGYRSVPLNTYCTDFSTTMDITIGERRDIVNVSIGAYFVVAFVSQYWRALTLPPGNSAAKLWSIACTIDLRLRPDGNLNTPPVAAIISPIYIPVGIQQAIYIPTIDADNDQVRCRFATNNNISNECANVCPPDSLPNGTVLLSNCTLFITGVNVSDWYAVAIMIEDFADSISTTPFSKVPVQFLINVRANSSCTTRPLLIGPTSETGDCFGIQVGQTYVIELIAENFCPSFTTITDIATLSFPVIIKTPLVHNSTTIWSTTLTWTPTALSIGSQVLCAVAIDSKNVQSNQYCLTFTVAQDTVPTCPGVEPATTQTSSQTTQSLNLPPSPTSEMNEYMSIAYLTSYFLTSGSASVFNETTELLFTSAISSTITIEESTSGVIDSTFPWYWIAALAFLALISCLCCCYACIRLCCFWYPYKRPRRRPLSETEDDDHHHIITNNSIAPSPTNTNDIQLTVFPTPRNQIRPHYTLALNRALRASP